MSWTKTSPTADGWYWWRRNQYKANCMYYVFSRSGGLRCRRSFDRCEDSEPVVDIEPGEWLGPLSPETVTDLADMQAACDLRWKADMRAIKRWQSDDASRQLVWPDHADLCVWLLEDNERLRKQIEGHCERIAAQSGLLTRRAEVAASPE